MRAIWVTLLLTAALMVTGPSLLAAESNEMQAAAKETDTAWKDKNIEAINIVRDLISDWANSWQQKDIDRYMSYYSRNFNSGGLDYSAWQEKKAKLFSRPGSVSLKVSDLWVVVAGNQASASFIQNYRDAHYSDVGEKTMDLVQNNGKWQIVAEAWRPLNP